MRGALIIIVLIISISRLACCEQPGEFQLSEWRPAAVSSAQYRAAIDEAIVWYRRNCVENGSGVVCTEPEYSCGIFFLHSVPELQYDPSAFLTEPLTLRAATRPEDFGFTRQ